MNEEKEIKFKQALILGNFYNKKVKIITQINEGYETIMDVIVGVKENFAITKEHGMIDKSTIKSIFKIA
ncbi:MAG: hypothetical protein ACNS60_20640 [Candidatus Cyclobacteriaceae bacterium M2_1C_046]